MKQTAFVAKNFVEKDFLFSPQFPFKVSMLSVQGRDAIWLKTYNNWFNLL